MSLARTVIVLSITTADLRDTFRTVLRNLLKTSIGTTVPVKVTEFSGRSRGSGFTVVLTGFIESNRDLHRVSSTVIRVGSSITTANRSMFVRTNVDDSLTESLARASLILVTEITILAFTRVVTDFTGLSLHDRNTSLVGKTLVVVVLPIATTDSALLSRTGFRDRFTFTTSAAS